MTERFNPPTRNQIARIASGDVRLIKAFEQLFEVAGTDIADLIIEVEGLTIRVAANKINIAALDARVTDNETNIASNTARIRTNEVLLWLSM